MSTEGEYDCIVIGAGVQGSFTAHELVKKKQRTLLLEQFILPHTRGSSHGQTRIIRKAYELDFYTQLMHESYEMWAQLESESGVKLYRQTGLLVLGPEDSHSYQMFKSTLQKNKIPSVALTPDNFNQHIPHFNLTEGDEAVVDIKAGVLFADRALRTVQSSACQPAEDIIMKFASIPANGSVSDRQFEKLGGIIRDKEKVIDIKPGPVVTVSTTAGVYQAKSVVITAGPWANKLLAHTGLQLPLQVTKINVCYWKEKVPGSYSVNKRFPSFLQLDSKETMDHIYGLPSQEYPGLMKICLHTGSPTDPDQRDKQTDRSDIDILRRYITRCIPGLHPEPAVVESCMYTVTPDSHFVLDCHPEHRNIVIGAGFSGHGFKFGPIIGKLLSELSLGQVPSFDLSPFRIRRFQGQTKSAL